jgi:hypothetical protein
MIHTGMASTATLRHAFRLPTGKEEFDGQSTDYHLERIRPRSAINCSIWRRRVLLIFDQDLSPLKLERAAADCRAARACWPTREDDQRLTIVVQKTRISSGNTARS